MPCEKESRSSVCLCAYKSCLDEFGHGRHLLAVVADLAVRHHRRETQQTAGVVPSQRERERESLMDRAV